MTRYFVATASDGTVFKRSSANRAYSHCVAIHRTVPPLSPEKLAEIHPDYRRLYGVEYWQNGEWASRADLAAKNAARNHNGSTSIARVEMLEAREVTGAEFRKIEGRP
jgi:hypothetical protein